MFFTLLQPTEDLLIVRALKQSGLITRERGLAEWLQSYPRVCGTHRPRHLTPALRPGEQLGLGAADIQRELEVALRGI